MNQKIKRSTSLGKNIKMFRLKSGLGVTELAKIMQLEGCETTREAINKIEAGNQNISLAQLKIFVKAFEVTYDTFFKFLEEDFIDG